MPRNTGPAPSRRSAWTWAGAARTAAAALSLLAAVPPAAPARAALLSYGALLARPRPTAEKRLPYGPSPSQFADLYLPAGGGAHRLVVLVHGGCWLASLPGLDLMAYLAGDLRARGYAVWNVEYRRIGEAGGGFPGTFQDVGKAVDALRALAGRYHLDLRHVVIVGHSAGGHLALWAAARHKLDKADPLFVADPLPLAGAVSLAGIDDLQTYKRVGGDACGGPSTIDALVGADRRAPATMFLDTSPAALLPIGTPQAIFSGQFDPIVPPIFGTDYAARAKAAQDAVEAFTLPGAGHFELIDPTTPAWAVIVKAIAGMAL